MPIEFKARGLKPARRGGRIAGEGRFIDAVLAVPGFLLRLTLVCLFAGALSLGHRAASYRLETGEDGPLISLDVSLELPAGPAEETRLRFRFGFGTDEFILPGIFYDSFSVSLAREEDGLNALLFTVDAAGVTWAPPNPGGLSLNLAAMRYEEIAFGLEAADFEVSFAYSVSYELPSALLGRRATLYLDLFDNGNESGSLAWLDDVEVTDGAPVQARLYSSAAPAGPYAPEPEAVLDSEGRMLRTPLISSRRFFRLRSNAALRVSEARIEGDRWVMGYQYPELMLALQSAPAAAGPYEDVAGAEIDWENSRVKAPENGAAFFRLRSSYLTRITGLQRGEGGVTLTFQVEPELLVLQSAPVPEGPYSDEQAVRFDFSRQELSVPRSGAARFYRIEDQEARTIRSIRAEGGFLMLTF